MFYYSKSAKNRRKADRKKHSLKEGSQYEDIALMEAIQDIVNHANTIQGITLFYCNVVQLVIHGVGNFESLINFSSFNLMDL